MDSLDFIGSNLNKVLESIEHAFANVSNVDKKHPRLVAVSKLQPKEYIIEAYRCGQRHFGENYIQELHEKATDQEILTQCPDIQWHLIGHVQSNKINKLLSTPNLSVVQTVDSIKLAESLNNHLSRGQDNDKKLQVFVQVNTSDEQSKSGVNVENVIPLVEFIINKCNHLHFVGLMTIGAYGYDVTLGPNPDFIKLLQVRDNLVEKLNLSKTTIELSMGMSSDYEHAISFGSTVVRVGTSIFGTRPIKS